MRLKPVGVLGGMGPQATVLLMQKVIAAVPAKDDGDHIPLLVDQNTQVPSRLRHLLEAGSENPGPVLAGMALRLQSAGAEALAMPCNTAHYYAAEIGNACDLPLLDMVVLSVEYAASLAPDNGCVGILASPAVRKVGLFDQAMKAAGLRALYSDDQTALVAAIRAIKSLGPNEAARATLRSASAELLGRGALVQMIACTEFSLVADEVAPGVSAFDTLDRLVLAIVEFSRGDPDSRQQNTQYHRQTLA